MHKYLIIIATSIFIYTQSFANENLIEQTKSTVFPRLSSLSIEKYLWQPPENRFRKWWDDGQYYKGNMYGRCSNHQWSQQGNTISLQCELAPSWSLQVVMKGPFFGTYNNRTTASIFDITRIRTTRHAWDWTKIKTFNNIKESENLRNIFIYKTKTSKDKEEHYNICFNLQTDTLLQLTKLFNSNQSTKNIKDIIEDKNILLPQKDKIIYISIPESHILNAKSIDFKSKQSIGGEDPAFDNNIFYGSNFQPLYTNLTQTIKSLYQHKTKENSDNFIKAYKNIIDYKTYIYQLIGEQLNAFPQMRDNLTLNIKFNLTSFNEIRIKDAYITARWTDGTQKEFHTNGSPERLIKQAIEPISHSGPKTKYEEFYYTFVDGSENLNNLYKE